VADRRYSSVAWRRLRRAIILRDGGLCQVRGPRCTRIATSAHHKRPSSQHPELFWDPTNLEAACTPCNHHGANVKVENRVNRQTIAYLEQVVEQLQVELDEAYARILELEGEVARRKVTPAIY
jgi:5-methylcytosine-specific restriction endonuclease McrA